MLFDATCANIFNLFHLTTQIVSIKLDTFMSYFSTVYADLQSEFSSLIFRSRNFSTMCRIDVRSNICKVRRRFVLLVVPLFSFKNRSGGYSTLSKQENTL